MSTLWQHVAVVCAICSHTWVAVFPIEAPGLECPACHYLNAVPE